jgi:dedicator of cytokinesis protein 3
MEEIWLEKTFFTTEETFPTVLRRSEVVAVEVLEISPVENALNELEQKTKELLQLNAKYSTLARIGQDVSTNELAMTLNSVIDAPINTGIGSYRHVYFSPDYVSRHPERAGLVEKLKAAVDDHVRTIPLTTSFEPLPISTSQVRAIDACLKLYGQLCGQEFLAFHDNLEKLFRQNFQDEIRRLAVDASSNSDQLTVSASVRSDNVAAASQYQRSLYEQSLKRSMSSNSTNRPNATIPLLNVGRPTLTPPPLSPLSPRDGAHATSENATSSKTPLQRQLAHLARHGMNGVSSGPRDNGGSDSFSAESPHESFVNVGGNGIHATSASQASGTSVINSSRSIGSLKGRFSRFGSLNFGRRRS